MEATIPSVNFVVYLLAGVASVKKNAHCLGGHGYTYDINEVGKKKLVKDVPTSSGYYVGNSQRANTVVVVQDIICLTIASRASLVEALLAGYLEVLEVMLADPKAKNLCVVTPHKELDALVKTGKLGNNELSAEELELLERVQGLAKTLEANDSKVFFDLTGAVEGGMGNRQAFKQLELAQVVTDWSFNKEVNIERIPRKQYEEPESDFNKLVNASRWYFDTANREAFLGLVDGFRVYAFGRVEPDKSYYGKHTPDVTYSKLYTKQPITLLDKLFEVAGNLLPNTDGYLSAGDLNTITSKEMARLINTVPGVPMEKNKLLAPMTRQNDNRPMVLELINPVHMSYRIRDFHAGMDVIYEAFKTRNEENKSGYSTFYDITDQIYTVETNGKGVEKLKIHPDFTQTRSIFTLKVVHPNSKRLVPIRLSIGYDLPDRNSFNSVSDPKVKVWVVTDTRNPQGLRYASLVETEDFIYIQSAAVSNLRVLTLSELGKTSE